MGAVVRIAEVVEVRKRHRVVAADPDDDMFVDVAVAGRADVIVSGDKHLLALGGFQGIPIVKVVEALKR